MTRPADPSARREASGPKRDDVVDLGAWRARLQQGDRGPKRNLFNLSLYLRSLPGLAGEIRYNELSAKAEWRGAPVEDEDFVEMRLLMEQDGFQPNKDDVRNAVAHIARLNSYHPIRDYLDRLVWDQKPRLDRWLQALLGAPDTEYERTIGPKWLIGATARIYKPGCQMDSMLVLEGPQGLGKSTALATLFGREYFTEMTGDLRDHKRFVEQILGKWIIEFAELAAIRKSDLEMVKAVITMQIDRVQRSYAHTASEHPRQCILAATVNPRQGAGYLSDPTGNRRFWPIRCTAIDLPAIASCRDQIWAEAVYRFRKGEPWWLDPKASAIAGQEQETRVQIDPWEEVLEAHLIPGMSYTSAELLKVPLGVMIDRQTQAEKNRVCAIMGRLGWEQKVGKTSDRKSARIWRQKEA